MNRGQLAVILRCAHRCVALSSYLPKLAGNQRGYSLAEMLATIGISVAMLGLGAPMISNMQSQLSISQDARAVVGKLAAWRSEAVRLRRAISISFNAPDEANGTPGNIAVDLNADGEPDDSYQLGRNVLWLSEGAEGEPLPFSIDGMGKISNLPAPSVQVGLARNGEQINFTIYSTGLGSFAE